MSGKRGYVQARAALASAYEEYKDYWPADIRDDGSVRSASTEAVEEQYPNPFLEIHPNPSNASGYAVLQIPEDSEASFQITDYLGRVVCAKTVGGGTKILDIATDRFSSGVFICTLHVDGTLVSTEKWVIQH